MKIDQDIAKLKMTTFLKQCIAVNVTKVVMKFLQGNAVT